MLISRMPGIGSRRSGAWESMSLLQCVRGADSHMLSSETMGLNIAYSDIESDTPSA